MPLMRRDGIVQANKHIRHTQHKTQCRQHHLSRKLARHSVQLRLIRLTFYLKLASLVRVTVKIIPVKRKRSNYGYFLFQQLLYLSVHYLLRPHLAFCCGLLLTKAPKALSPFIWLSGLTFLNEDDRWLLSQKKNKNMLLHPGVRKQCWKCWERYGDKLREQCLH